MVKRLEAMLRDPATPQVPALDAMRHVLQLQAERAPCTAGMQPFMLYLRARVGNSPAPDHGPASICTVQTCHWHGGDLGRLSMLGSYHSWITARSREACGLPEPTAAACMNLLSALAQAMSMYTEMGCSQVVWCVV